MPRVSVIIPAHNPGRFLEAAIASVISQTYQDWELIVVDDGSTEELSGAARMHPSIRYIRQENRGVSAARNRGIAESRGEFVALLDSDDVWLPSKLDRQVTQLDDDATAGMSHTAWRYIDDADNLRGGERGRAVESYARLLRDCCIFISSILVRRKCVAEVGGFDGTLSGAADYDFFLRFCRRFTPVFVPEVSAYYRTRPGSMSGNPGNMSCESLRVLRRHRAIMKRDGARNLVAAADSGIAHIKTSYACMHFDRSRQHFRRQDWVACAASLLSAARLRPMFVANSIMSYSFHRSRRSESGPVVKPEYGDQRSW